MCAETTNLNVPPGRPRTLSTRGYDRLNTQSLAQPEKNRAGSAPAPQAVLFAEMRERAADYGMAPGIADPLFIVQAVDMAVARADAAILEFFQGGFYPFLHFPPAAGLQADGFVILEEVLRFRFNRQTDGDHRQSASGGECGNPPI